jgi:hypothetical protein
VAKSGASTQELGVFALGIAVASPTTKIIELGEALAGSAATLRNFSGRFYFAKSSRRLVPWPLADPERIESRRKVFQERLFSGTRVAKDSRQLQSS